MNHQILRANKPSVRRLGDYALFLIFMGIVLIFSTCKDPDSLFKEYVVPGGLYYPAMALNPEAYSGKNRINITWENGSDPKVVKARIFWSNDTESVEVPISPDMKIISKMIEPLEENEYTFKIRTYDADGNISNPVEINGVAYGDMYAGNLLNRPVRSAVYYDLINGIQVRWNEPYEKEAFLQLDYKDTEGVSRTLQVDRTESITTILDFEDGGELFLTTMYQPDSTAIDVLSPPRVSIPYTDKEPTAEIPYDKWTEYFLPGDHPLDAYRDGTRLSNIWNNSWENADGAAVGENLPLPCLMTVSLGETVILNRFQYWPCNRGAYDTYARGHAKKIELWGSMDPDESGSLAEWIPLGKFETPGPAGATPTPEEYAMTRYPEPGFIFDIEENDFAPDPFVPIRYIRIVTLSTFASETQSYVMYQGIKLYGYHPYPFGYE